MESAIARAAPETFEQPPATSTARPSADAVTERYLAWPVARSEPDLGGEMILVYFVNGESAAMPSGTHVRAEPFSKDGTDCAVHAGITCLDAEDREVGRFRVAEIIGYVIAGRAEAEDQEGLTADEFDDADVLTGDV